MKIPIKILFRHMNESNVLSLFIKEKCEGILSANGNIAGMQVVIDAPHKRVGRFCPCQVTIAASVSGKTLVTSHFQPAQNKRQNLMLVIHHAIAIMERQLEDNERRRHGDIKRKPPHEDGRGMHLVREQAIG